MQASAFVSKHGTAHDQVRCGDQIAQIKQVGADFEVGVVLLNFFRQQPYSMARPLEALVGANDADIVPHETAQFIPVMGNDDFFVGVRDAAFIPTRQ